MMGNDLENSTDFSQAIASINGILSFQAAMELTRP